MTRHQGYQYGDVEPWAWAKLQQRLTSVAARRLAVKAAPA